jgi:hypothetical protein
MKKIFHLMFYSLIFYGAFVSAATPVRAQSGRGTKTKVATGDTSRQLQRESARIAWQLDSLRKVAGEVDTMHAYQASLQQKTQRELQDVEGSPRWRLDRRRVDSLGVLLKAQGQKRDSLARLFDRMLVVIDSTVGLQRQLEARLKAKRDL